MTKNDKLKEEIAESRHKDIMLLMYGALGLAGVSVTIAFALWQSSAAFLSFALVVAALIWTAEFSVRRNKQKRKQQIEQLDNAIKKPAPDNSTKEPTLREIMDEIKNARKGSKKAITVSLAIWGGSIAITGATLLWQFGIQRYSLELIILGAAVVALSIFLHRKIK